MSKYTRRRRRDNLVYWHERRRREEIDERESEAQSAGRKEGEEFIYGGYCSKKTGEGECCSESLQSYDKSENGCGSSKKRHLTFTDVRTVCELLSEEMGMSVNDLFAGKSESEKREAAEMLKPLIKKAINDNFGSAKGNGIASRSLLLSTEIDEAHLKNDTKRENNARKKSNHRTSSIFSGNYLADQDMDNMIKAGSSLLTIELMELENDPSEIYRRHGGNTLSFLNSVWQSYRLLRHCVDYIIEKACKGNGHGNYIEVANIRLKNEKRDNSKLIEFMNTDTLDPTDERSTKFILCWVKMYLNEIHRMILLLYRLDQGITVKYLTSELLMGIFPESFSKDEGEEK